MGLRLEKTNWMFLLASKDELSLYEAIEKLENKKIPNEEKISTKLIIKSLKKQLSLYEYNQKAWILNAIEAMNVYF